MAQICTDAGKLKYYIKDFDDGLTMHRKNRKTAEKVPVSYETEHECCCNRTLKDRARMCFFLEQ